MNRIPNLQSTNWAQLHHAYGKATDTPAHLEALLGEDPQAKSASLQHLWGAIIHQGTPWTATESVALIVAGIVFDERIDRGEPVRPLLFRFLAAVAEACNGVEDWDEVEEMADADIQQIEEEELDEDAWNALYARALLGCRRATPALMRVMQEGLHHPDARVRAEASRGATILANCADFETEQKSLRQRVIRLANDASNPDERAAHVLELGSLGVAPREFLRDPAPGVRMCAALAPSLSDDPAAIAELLHAIELHVGEIDGWFVEKPPQFDARPRFSVIARLIQQVPDLDRLLPAALAVLRVTHKYCVDYDWGPLLAAFFPDRDGVIRRSAQARFLKALVDQQDLWDPTLGNAIKWFKMAGLPNDRQACAQLLDSTPV